MDLSHRISGQSRHLLSTGILFTALLLLAHAAHGQTTRAGEKDTSPKPPETPVQIDNAHSNGKADDILVPEANPARPTITNPAHIPPVGYLQFEQGILVVTASPSGVAHQTSVNQNTKLSVHPRLMLQVFSQPAATTRLVSPDTPPVATSTHDTGDLLLGVQTLLNLRSGLIPTVAVGYTGRVRAGSAPDIDLGSNNQSAVLLISGDIGQLHYDSNFGVAEQQDTSQTPTLRRAQYNQSVSATYPFPRLGALDTSLNTFTRNLTLTGELWHVTQPLVTTTRSGAPSPRSNAVGTLFTFGYSLRPYVVLDVGFDHGLTSTSSDWQTLAGFTYLLPHRLWPHATTPR